MKILRSISRLFLVVLFLNAMAFGQTGRPATKTSPVASQTTINPSPQEIAESGSFEERVYTNKLLAFTVSIPEGWAFASEDINKAMLAAGREKIKVNETEERQKALDKSISNTRILFQTSPQPIGQPGNSAVLTCGLEKLQMPQSRQAYAEFNKNLVVTSLKANLKKDLYSKIIGGKEFTAFDVEIQKDSFTVNQSYLVTKHKNVLFFVVLTFNESVHKKTLEDALQTLRFVK